MSVFRLSMLPANEGDCLILSYGDGVQPLRHVVVDGGRKGCWAHLKPALSTIEAYGETVELLLLSHIDADHIDGLRAFAEDPHPPLVPIEIWHNGFVQLQGLATRGGLQPMGFPAADAYSKALADKGWTLNHHFGGKAIVVGDEPMTFDFADLRLTLLSPTVSKLRQLWSGWRTWHDAQAGGLQPLGKRPMPAVLDVERLSAASPEDSTVPNGSSIAMIIEYGGRSVLLGADAHPDILTDMLDKLAVDGALPRFDLVKLPHHGSRANVTRALLERMDCHRFAISTSGAVFGHPDPEAISRILRFGSAGHKLFYFNYASDRTTPWNDGALKQRWDYECRFPDQERQPLVIDI
ncbi:hypothetical protein J3E64_000698 [Sphingobium sp. OAS761]|uniref:ComEC/Rec2 family competence protein n=1 Tax=Sphingobium sp. OAS761 TaxID=2817901 RepID=UPI0020A1E196|nr:hypothetical protein [Sphingobium sp. OAS761]MCP1469027.1 hypothetical protein [Sphingobium sp. OAS761]